MIKEDDLCNQAKVSGAYLHDKMLEMQEAEPDFVKTARALGTLQAFDCKDVDQRNALIK